MKYNVYDDELLLQIDQRFGGGILRLYKPLISRFQLGMHIFLNLEPTEPDTGFHELLLKKSSFSLFKKHRKALRQLLGEKLVFYEFLEDTGTYLLGYDNTYHPIETTDEIPIIFPEHATALIAFDRGLDPKVSGEQRLKRVLEFLDTLLVRANPKVSKN